MDVSDSIGAALAGGKRPQQNVAITPNVLRALIRSSEPQPLLAILPVIGYISLVGVGVSLPKRESSYTAVVLPSSAACGYCWHVSLLARRELGTMSVERRGPSNPTVPGVRKIVQERRRWHTQFLNRRSVPWAGPELEVIHPDLGSYSYCPVLRFFFQSILAKSYAVLHL
jgi:hypothetical protein